MYSFKFIIILLLLVIPDKYYSQDLKKITKNHSRFYEIFYVLKNNPEIKEGSYKKLNYENKIIEEGNYVNNKKESIWREYYPQKKKPLRYLGNYKEDLKDSLWIGYYENGKVYSQGIYSEGKRVGIWEFFDEKGSEIQKYDFDRRSVLLNKDTAYFPYKLLDIVNDSSAVIPPFFIGGTKEFLYEWRNIDVILPPVRDELNEHILVGIVLKTQGQREKLTIEKGEYYDMNQAALEVVAKLSDNWHPAEFYGEKIKTKILLDVNFRNYFVPVRMIQRGKF